MSFLSILFLVCLSAYYIHGNENKPSKLILKWVVYDNLPTSQQPLQIQYLLKGNINHDGCHWYRQNENKPISETSNDASNSFMYISSKQFCILSIADFNTKTMAQLDYYRLALNKSANQDTVFAVVYLKSFRIEKEEKTKNSHDYKCHAEVTVPEIDDSDTKNIVTALNENLIFITNDISNPKELAKMSRPKSIFKKISESLKHFFSIQKRQNKNMKTVVDYTLSSDSVQIFKGKNEYPMFQCILKLKEDNEIIYTKVLNEDYEINKFESETSLATKLQFKLMFCFSSFLFYFY